MIGILLLAAIALGLWANVAGILRLRRNRTRPAMLPPWGEETNGIDIDAGVKVLSLLLQMADASWRQLAFRPLGTNKTLTPNLCLQGINGWAAQTTRYLSAIAGDVRYITEKLRQLGSAEADSGRDSAEGRSDMGQPGKIGTLTRSKVPLDP